jgi:voltage-gated potassium channel
VTAAIPGKVLVFGCGPLGLEVAEQLKARSTDLLLVDDDADRVAQAEGLGFAARRLSYTDDRELESLGIGSDVDVVFSLFMQDSENVFLTISVRALAAGTRIVAVTQSRESARKLLAAGASKVIDPYEISSRKIHELIRRPLVAETLERTVFGRHDLDMAEVRVPGGSYLDGRRMQEVDLAEDYDLVLLGVVDRDVSDELVFATSALDRRLDADDVLVVIGPADEIDAFKADLASDRPRR